MLSQKHQYQSFDSEVVLPVSPTSEVEDSPTEANTSTTTNRFHSQHSDCMEMLATAHQVAEYLNEHQKWFATCAQPMTVEPLGENGYALTIGRFGSFGYEVEPKIGLELMPADAGVYRIRTIPVPDYVAPGYEVDYQASLHLVEVANEGQEVITRVEWELDLTVNIHFPRFIQRLPKSLVQTTGDRLLNQIVRQVSRRLTYKVQQDFHQSQGTPFPPKSKKR
ncbi:MAG: DUF1997 domain-containing protein [Nostocaceae cyanobacterium]|nr:DUF1997 domain-containing protein [Nostocaceae cyanobacterium]